MLYDTVGLLRADYQMESKVLTIFLVTSVCFRAEGLPLPTRSIYLRVSTARRNPMVSKRSVYMVCQALLLLQKCTNFKYDREGQR